MALYRDGGLNLIREPYGAEVDIMRKKDNKRLKMIRFKTNKNKNKTSTST